MIQCLVRVLPAEALDVVIDAIAGGAAYGMVRWYETVDDAARLTKSTDGVETPDPNPKHLVSWCF